MLQTETNHTHQLYVGNTPLVIDFLQLAHQREVIGAAVQNSRTPRKLASCLDGLSNFFDAFVDAAAEALGRKVVFPPQLDPVPTTQIICHTRNPKARPVCSETQPANTSQP